MRTIALIEQAEGIRKTSKHLGLWGNRFKPLPRATHHRNAMMPKKWQSIFPPRTTIWPICVYPVDANF